MDEISMKYCYRGLPIKGKVIRVTGREDPLGCKTSKLPHFL
jgi:hypothetical protein